MLCCWCQDVSRLIATSHGGKIAVQPFSRNGAPTENSVLQPLHQGLPHRAPHFHFINIHSQESKIGNSQGRQNSCNRVICQQRYYKCAEPLILEAEFSLFRAGEPMSSSSFTWCFPQGRKKVKHSEGAFTASIWAVKFSLTAMQWKAGSNSNIKGTQWWLSCPYEFCTLWCDELEWQMASERASLSIPVSTGKETLAPMPWGKEMQHPLWLLAQVFLKTRGLHRYSRDPDGGPCHSCLLALSSGHVQGETDATPLLKLGSSSLCS